MELELIPEPSEVELEAALAALAAAQIPLGGQPPVYYSAWRQAGLEEGVERDSEPTPAAAQER